MIERLFRGLVLAHQPFGSRISKIGDGGILVKDELLLGLELVFP